MSRVRGVNSSARVPALGDRNSEALYQQPGVRMPELVKICVVGVGFCRAPDDSWRQQKTSRRS